MPATTLSPERSDDTALMRAAAAGSERAAAELYRRHLPTATRACAAIAHCEADVADAAQEALLATLARLPELDVETLRFGAYVHVAARRAAATIARRRARHVELEADGVAAQRLPVTAVVIRRRARARGCAARGRGAG